MCIIGNKVDLRDKLPQGNCVNSLHGEKLAKVRHVFLSPDVEPVYRAALPPRCLNKLGAIRSVNALLAGIRCLVL